MEVVELRFLLMMLGYPPDYRVALSNIRPAEKLSERNRACRQLVDRRLIDCSTEVMRFKTTPAGKALLRLDAARLPVSDVERLILKAGLAETVTPGQALKGVHDNERQSMLSSLAERGFIQTETRIQDVWLTTSGQLFLQYECVPQGNPTISLNLLSNYLGFLRRAYAQSLDSDSLSIAQTLRWKKSTKPHDDEIHQMIRAIDHELGTNNYLPIFHVRSSLQPPLTRDELDQALYRLQRNDVIDLSSLQEAVTYSSEQIEAGIPQDIGGPLFFITLLENPIYS
ncbi:MAG: hypothetical protein AAF327_07940 [Cyanobacteria bacterium P01_A01_bin.37]